MQLGYVGINYKNTDLSVRDKITFTDSGIADFMQQAEEAGVNQCMCLSTCNRCEVFYLYEDETFVQVMSDLFNPALSECLLPHPASIIADNTVNITLAEMILITLLIYILRPYRAFIKPSVYKPLIFYIYILLLPTLINKCNTKLR